ncbi:MAG: Photosystem I reaction center subunit IX [Cyanosarcina radialis HA8281-LM2]|jgi:photosystem I subunit 9|nr:Photosystem I reaction center subunit IX [Cyanosarcina radialis HA8281-LM2]
MTKFLSLAPVILFLWLIETAIWLIVFNYAHPDLLFHPL